MSPDAAALACVVCSVSAAPSVGMQCSMCLARHPDEQCVVCGPACYRLHFGQVHRGASAPASVRLEHSRPSSPAPSLALSCTSDRCTATSDKPVIPANPPRAPKFLRAPMRPSAPQSTTAGNSPAPKAPGTPRHGHASHHHAHNSHHNAGVAQGRLTTSQGQLLPREAGSPAIMTVPPHPHASTPTPFSASAAARQLLPAMQLASGGFNGQLAYAQHTPLTGGPLAATLAHPIQHLPLQLHSGSILPGAQLVQVPLVVRYGGY